MSEFYMKVAGVTFGSRQRTVARLKSGQEEPNYQILCNLMNKTGSYKV